MSGNSSPGVYSYCLVPSIVLTVWIRMVDLFCACRPRLLQKMAIKWILVVVTVIILTFEGLRERTE